MPQTPSHPRRNRTVAIAGTALAVIMVLTAIFFWRARRDHLVPETERLVFGTSASVSTGLIGIADGKGYFRAEGVPVEVRRYRSAAVAFREMLDGKIHMAGVAETPLVHERFVRDDFRIFAVACTSSSDPKIVARRDAGIAAPRDLAGKRIGSTRKGQSAHFFLSLFLLKYGISERDVAILHDSPASVVDRLSGGDLDAASLFEPYAYMASAALGDNAKVFQEIGLYHKTFCLSAGPRFLEREASNVERFLRALIRAEAFVQAHPAEAKRMMARDLSVEPALVDRFWQNATFTVDLPYSLLGTMKDQAQWVVEEGLTDADHAPDFRPVIAAGPLRAIDAARVGHAWERVSDF